MPPLNKSGSTASRACSSTSSHRSASHHSYSRRTLSAASSRASSGSSKDTGLRLAVKPFGFGAKTSYDATEGLFRSRSEAFLFKPKPKDNSIWSRKPPNFSPQSFIPKPPKRNTQDSVKPWNYKETGRIHVITKEEENTDKTEENIPLILRARRAKTADIITYLRPLTPGTDRMKTLKDRDSQGPYKNPEPHDFRQYPPLSKLGLPEFETGYEKDPYGIHFQTDRLNTLHGNIYLGSTREMVGEQIGAKRPDKTKMFEDANYLPKSPWPSQVAEYTRHRVPARNAHSALMRRIETNLTAQWAKEKLEKELEKCSP